MKSPRTDGAPARGAAAEREASIRGRPLATITLVRHGEPDWSPAGRPSVSDPGLTSFGVAQAQATADAVAGRAFDAVYVSPYRRAQQTARELCAVTGNAPVTIDQLAEIAVAVDGLSEDDVERYFAEGSRRPLYEHWDGWPGAETFRDFHGRITAGITEILERHECHPYREHGFTVWDLPEKQPSIAIVAHAGTNAVIVTHLLDIEPVPWEWMRFETGLAAYSILQARPVGPTGHVWSLQCFNRDEHLVAAGLR